MSDSDDRYSRLQYRRLIAWPARIRREAPLMLEVLRSGPGSGGGRVLDLGCGPGQHARFLAGEGYEVVGIDASPAMIEACHEEEIPDRVSFVLGDIRGVDEQVEGLFDGAICLGNTLPHLLEDEDLVGLLAGLRRRLVPGAPVLIQILNYQRILEEGVRYLPLNFRPDEGEADPSGGDTGREIVFLRLMEPQEDGTVLFFPSTLLWRHDADPPLEVVASKRVRLRAWTPDRIDALLEAAGFTERRRLGGFDGSPFVPLESQDLLLIAR